MGQGITKVESKALQLNLFFVLVKYVVDLVAKLARKREEACRICLLIEVDLS